MGLQLGGTTPWKAQEKKRQVFERATPCEMGQSPGGRGKILFFFWGPFYCFFFFLFFLFSDCLACFTLKKQRGQVFLF